MRVDKFTYAQVESCLYEAMRTYIKGGKVLADREGNALIDTSMTKYNETYVHDCLKPISLEPAKRKKDRNGNTSYYRKDENGNNVEYVRGQTIADYHNSQVKSKYQKARMNGNEKELSKAIGFITTLPKDYIQGVIPDISDAEYEYLTNKLEAEAMHRPFTIDEVYEQSLHHKFSKHEWTSEELEKAKEFLLASKDCVLDEMGIRKEDVLFYSLHVDESFPHIHVLALCTQEKTYEHDVYSKKKKKDGTYTLLHKKGETEISYSVSQYYEKNMEGEYTFFKDFHQNVVDRMATKGFDASGLIQGVTSGKGFTPAQMNHEQREESVKQSMKILALQKKLKQLEEKKTQAEAKASTIENKLEVTTKQLELVQEELTIAISEKELAEAKASTCEEQVAKTTRELEEMNDALEEKEIEFNEKVAQVESLRDIIKDLKSERASLVKEVALFVPNVIKAFIKGWKEAKTKSQMEKIDSQARAEALAGVNDMTQHLQELGSRAEALLEEDEIVNGINMATFNQTDQKIGFAKNQIVKSANLCGKAEVFADRRVLAFALQDWFDKDKHKERIASMSELDASLYMKFPNRAARAVEYALEKIEEMELDIGLD